MKLTHDDARHLVVRTGLGGHPSEIAAMVGDTRQRAVGRLLDAVQTRASTRPPSWTAEPPRPRPVLVRELGSPQKVEEMFRERMIDAKAWWVREMVETDSPLTERLTLFWHNHFTSSMRKVRRPKLLFWQNQLLRRHALGNFRTLLHEVAQDPAMLVYLDNFRNFAGAPNENFARELLELFTLGEGHYTEADVKAAARAFTGWTVSRRNGEFQNRRHAHDSGEKTFLGETGRFDGADVIDIILQKRQCAQFVTEKLWDAFVGTPIEPGQQRKLATKFREEEFELRGVVEAILRDEAFWSAGNRATMIKSPVELVVGTVRTLELDVPDDRLMVRACRALGQDLFDPPNVKGWAGGTSWIAANTLLRRVRLMLRASTLQSTIPGQIDEWLGGLWADEPLDLRIQRVLLAVPAVQSSPSTDSPRRFVAQLLTDPSYQLA